VPRPATAPRGLRRLGAPQPCALDGLDHAVVRDPLERVGQRLGGERGAMFECGLRDQVEQRRLGERARRVVHQHHARGGG
jgi:hypothetical protein